jgi:hypothetical protein
VLDCSAHLGMRRRMAFSVAGAVFVFVAMGECGRLFVLGFATLYTGRTLSNAIIFIFVALV